MPAYQVVPRPYEMMVLFNPELADEALTAAIDGVTGILTESGAQRIRIKRDQPWGRRRLAYPIEGFRDATYVLMWFSAGASAIAPIEREIKLDQRVIRYLLVRLSDHEAEALEAEAAEAALEEAARAAEAAQAEAARAEAARAEQSAEEPSADGAEPAAAPDDASEETTDAEATEPTSTN